MWAEEDVAEASSELSPPHPSLVNKSLGIEGGIDEAGAKTKRAVSERLTSTRVEKPI